MCCIINIIYILIITTTTTTTGERQAVLEAVDLETRLSLALDLIRKELQVVQIQSEINKTVEENMTKQQREVSYKCEV